MDSLNQFLESLKEQETEIRNRDIDSIVADRLVELEDKIRAEETEKQKNDLKLIEVKIETANEMIAYLAEKSESEEEEPVESVDEPQEQINI